MDHLSDEQYNVRVPTIVGTDLRLVERITGRLTWGKVIWTGALSGLWFGLFMGVLFALWTANDALLVVLVGLVMGVFFGIILNVVRTQCVGASETSRPPPGGCESLRGTRNG